MKSLMYCVKCGTRLKSFNFGKRMIKKKYYCPYCKSKYLVTVKPNPSKNEVTRATWTFELLKEGIEFD